MRICVKLEHHTTNNILVIEVKDEIHGMLCSDINDFYTSIIELLNGNDSKVAFNMSKKSYLNSTGLGDLIRIKDRLNDNKTELILINPMKRVKSIMSMIGVIELFNIIENENDLA